MAPQTLAHSPLAPGDNESLATATFIHDPTKSWAIYGELHEGGEAQYYRFNVTVGDRIHIMLFKPTSPEEGDFMPGFVLMGPGVGKQGIVPDYVEVPAGADTLVVMGEQPDQATYEPFSPSSFFSLADLELEAPNSDTYYAAVYEPSMGGHYGLAIGDRESYTLSEWILIPLNLLSVYQWEGQSLAFIIAPLIATLVIGIGLLIWLQLQNKTALRTLFGWLGSLAGLLFVGTGAMTLTQMVFSLTQAPLTSEIVITLLFASIPIVLGLVTLRLSLKTVKEAKLRMRIYLAVLGVVALFMWAGFLIGPALAIVASVLPSRLVVGKS